MVRLFGVATVALLFALGAGCNPNPFCLNCMPGGDGGGVPVGAGDLAQAADLLVEDGLSGPDMRMPDMPACIAPRMTCGAACIDVQNDPNNCGKCGMECTYPHAAGLCMNGMCSMGFCQPGFYDLDGNPANGCEYACTPTPPAQCKVDKDCPFGLPCNNGQCIKQCKTNQDCSGGTLCDPDTLICEGEICDGRDNNCNGKVDEGYDLQNDVNNCGACNTACTFPNAAGKCAMGQCTISTCNKGFYDLDKNPADGCEYACVDQNMMIIDPPRAETCNGIDDDCDGVIDDHLTDVGTACDDYCPMIAACAQQGNCGAFQLSKCSGKCCGICTEGMTICAGGKKVCQMGMGPKLEVCNGVDDNCDGQIDEGFDLQNDPLNCGKCGNNCMGMVPNAVAGCTRGMCSVLQCKPGFKDLDGNPQNGCEYMCPVNPPTVETCNGKDDDCNGVVDDNLTPPKNFCTQVGPCMGAKPVCCGGSGWLCNYPSVNAKIEVTGAMMCQGGQTGANLVFAETLCDGIDGNCNGMIDESFTNLGKVCTVGQGACAGTSKFICDPNNATQLTCPTTATAMNATDELCNGIDDDCDGQVDERTPMGNPTCYNGGAHACLGYSDPMVQVGNVWVYQYEASRVDATANVVGSGAGRSCSKVGVQPWAPVTVGAAAMACAAIKDSMGMPMRLCTAAEWQAACNVGVMPPAQVWSYAQMPTTYQAAVCNGADANVGKAWTTGSGASCYAKQGNGNLFDMSGNVAEWTGTTVMYNGITYNKVRGGGYSTPGGGMSCNFDFVIETASYQFNDLGFRCCADHAP